MGASTAPMPEDIEGLRAQNRAYRSLCTSLEATQAIQAEQGRKYQEAITTLDSEREANARLTDEVDRLRVQLTDAHQALRNLAEGNLGDLPWQANYERIKQVARAALVHSTPNPKGKP